jgi:hypothetical protein
VQITEVSFPLWVKDSSLKMVIGIIIKESTVEMCRKRKPRPSLTILPGAAVNSRLVTEQAVHHEEHGENKNTQARNPMAKTLNAGGRLALG